MCGIVGYFGGAGNGLTRVLTAMSAIIYRAPDSTGVGLFGDDQEPIRVRKSIGSVARLSETLLGAAAYPNQSDKLLALWSSDDRTETYIACQRRVMGHEGFDVEGGRERIEYPDFEALLGQDGREAVRLRPGTPGRPGPIPPFFVRSRRDLSRLIATVTERYDLSAVVVQTLIRHGLSGILSIKDREGVLEIDPADILAAFDRLFEDVFLGERGAKPVRLDYGWSHRNPFAQKYVWRYLKETPIRIPEDFDRDGVRCLFRLLDAALLARLPVDSQRHVAVQRELESLWPRAREIPNTDWRTLYWAEKGANVYGRAAAAVYSLLRREAMEARSKSAGAAGAQGAAPAEPGRTDPSMLAFLSQPVISHGRWALQSAVTLKNAHPFLDGRGHRAVVLNGQFSGEVEARTRDFLEQIGRVTFRSENSTEYFALLWGYYFENLIAEQRRSRDIRSQIDGGFEAFNIGSQSLDYAVYQRVKDRAAHQLDELAFLETVRQMAWGGGQIAVSGVSLHSPWRVYVACHNRPAFVVQRPDGDDFMVVSDINAALGLFPQSLIHRRTLQLNEINRRRPGAGDRTPPERSGGKGATDPVGKDPKAEEALLLRDFRVVVHPLEGEEIFVKIETRWIGGSPVRELTITDFEGRPLPEIRPFETVLNPVQVRKDFHGTFYETHLHEIPDRLSQILHFYLPEAGSPPGLPVRGRFLRRRFGPGLAALKRIILAGMGSSYHVGLMVKGFLRHLMPRVDVVALQAVEIEEIAREIVPEKDLLVLFSWSATTADMVQLANDLKERSVTMIGVTEKVFADMALVTRDSGGVIPVLSGEEITIPGIKSTLCMTFIGQLLGLWLSSVLGREGGIREYESILRGIPGMASDLLKDPDVEAFCNRLATASGASRSTCVIGALHAIGTSREAALKLEENSWTAVGKPMDYRDFYDYPLGRDLAENLVVVNATCGARLEEAMNVMKRLYIAGIPFATVTYEHVHREEAAFYSSDRCVVLPKLPDPLQPLMDLLFYYRFALVHAKAHGRRTDDFPRNRAKSVTAGRGRSKARSTPATEMMRMETFLRGLGPPSVRPTDAEAPTAWEEDAPSDWERVYYRQMRGLSAVLSGPDPLAGLSAEPGEDPESLAALLFDELSQEGEVVFLPFDRPAHAAARQLALRWGRLLDCTVRVAGAGEPLTRAEDDDSLMVFLAAREVSEKLLLERLRNTAGPCLWVGPETPRVAERVFRRSMGYHVPDPRTLAFIEADVLYACVSLLFSRAWKVRDPQKGGLVERLFAVSAEMVDRLLGDRGLKEEIDAAMAENRGYRTAFLLSHPGGAGDVWMDIFDGSGCMILQSHLFGESAHGPLATVDDRVQEKFVRLSGREQMVRDFGEDRVGSWEDRFLAGERVDDFLHRSPARIEPRPDQPFFAEGDWYIPVLAPGYDPNADNLIVMDGTHDRYVPQLLDELATYGCRHARIVTVTQAAFRGQTDKRAMYKHPVSRFLFLPPLEAGGRNLPIPEEVLPFAMNLVGMAMGAAAAKARGLDFRPASPERAFEGAFGPVGRTMIRQRMDIGYMDHRLIESLKNLSAMVSKVEGVARYAVKVIENEAELRRMVREGRLHSPEETMEKYTVQAASHLAFYLLHPEREGFEGKARYLADQTFQNGEWDLWGEPYGNAWKVLTHRTLGIQESADGFPLLMIPLVDQARRRGWLYYFHVEYRQWDHGRDFEEEILETARALGKGMRFHHYISPRYLKIVSRFNEEMVTQGHTWDDRLLGLVDRPVLFLQPSKALAEVIAGRCLEIMRMGTDDGAILTVGAVGDALQNVWPRTDGAEGEGGGKRWRILAGALQKS